MAPLDEVRAWLMQQATRRPSIPTPVLHAAGWVLSEDVLLPVLPAEPAAAIDGLAVRASDTEGASDYAPIPLSGTPIRAGEALPPGTNAVLPPESFDEGPLALSPVAPGSYVTPAGHDAPQGALISAGTVLRPLHLSLLARGGHGTVPVVRQPRVVLRASDHRWAGGIIALIPSLIEAEGGLVAEDPAETDGSPPPDLILHIEHSPATRSDAPHGFGTFYAPAFYAPAETASCAAPGIVLPGDPLRCLTLFTLLLAPALRRMGGRPEPAPISATLTRKVTSALGQLDAIPIRLEAGLATPLGPADGCSLLAATAADGLLLVPENSEGYPAGATVSVQPLP